MKVAAKAVAMLAVCGAVLAEAQLPTFQHVILVIQENRTPDNLFAGVPPQNGWNGPWFEKGVDLLIKPNDSQNAIQWCLGACFNPGHGNDSWQKQYNNGQYNSQLSKGNSASCTTPKGATTCNNNPVCVYPNQCAYEVPQYPQDTYVSYTYDSDPQGNPVLLPYVGIATQYGFANYFYQTNQGPSQSAHDILFGGTSAPAGSSSDQYGQYLFDFAAGNPTPAPINPTGCYAPPGQTRGLINPQAQTGFAGLYPCFEHQTLSDLLESKNLSWRYYTDSLSSIWTAPNGIKHICQPQNSPPTCDPNSDFAKHVFKNGPKPNAAKILSDINGCALQSVSWVIPNGDRSDHPGLAGGLSSTSIEGGPNWVANIINAVGNDAGKCGYWNNTVIFVVWDDWGGFYDHMAAGYEVLRSGCGGLDCYPLWGSGYTYGFRVPFMVVSAYTTPGYVSGACGTGEPVTCPNNVYPYQHDFGSILAFIENNFSLGIGSINNLGQATGGPLFADNWAPESVASGGTAIPLADFFTSTWHPFVPIPTTNNGFTLNYFNNYSGPMLDPDNDATDLQN